uniref:Exonuclease domain-containing protein n=1 Tax=Timema shepardi TaxID=629360 RepID=A0A7R9FV26_TIMSH|nr:unnamed protein product [Timema shepardi]
MISPSSAVKLNTTSALANYATEAGLRGALSELGINFEGREHSGLCDARNTAHLAWRIVQDGGVLKITTNINTTLPNALVVLSCSTTEDGEI